jgi:hypothetical protein
LLKNILVLGSKWVNVANNQKLNVKLFQDIMMIDKIDIKNKGKYGCEVQNGIEPSLWAIFDIDVAGKIAVKIT